MKVLWLVNIRLPELSKKLGEKPSPFGGWLINASKDISNENDLDLAIVSPIENTESLATIEVENIKYYLFSALKDNKFLYSNRYKDFEKILDDFRPDLVHIFGTEYSHSLAMVNSCAAKGINVVISIQGLISVIAKHYMANLPISVQRNYTFRDLIKRDNLKLQQQKFINRGRFEIEALKSVKHIIGRTNWDKSCTSIINPKANYYNCNETLRPSFYKYKWDYYNCEKFSIFISQATYPIKGAHFVIEALKIVVNQFPNTKLYISGKDITKSDTLTDNIKRTSYGKYLKEMIEKYNLKENIVFTGILNEDEMCQRYLKSHIFVCPSAIENSPNSLGEAMILGVPTIASYVGGIPDMLIDKEEGFLYQHDAPYMLAHYICVIFGNKEYALKFSRNARYHALKTHDREKNNKKMIEIYNKIISN